MLVVDINNVILSPAPVGNVDHPVFGWYMNDNIWLSQESWHTEEHDYIKLVPEEICSTNNDTKIHPHTQSELAFLRKGYIKNEYDQWLPTCVKRLSIHRLMKEGKMTILSSRSPEHSHCDIDAIRESLHPASQ